MAPTIDGHDLDELTERLRLSFGSVAEQYDAVRPAYPEDLIDTVLDYAGIRPGERALDIGAGTGQATMRFADRGLRLHALEPSEQMAALADRKLRRAGLDGSCEVSEFESASLEDDGYQLIYSATAWHWIDPEVRWERVARAIAPGGTFAVFWNWPCWRESTLRPELDSVYLSSGVDVSALAPMFSQELDTSALVREWLRDTGASGVFTEPQGKLYSWSQTYTAERYAALLGTYGDHIVLEPEARERLLDGVREVIDAAGGSLELPHRTLLLLARATA